MSRQPMVAITDYTFPDLSVEAGILEPFGCEIVAGQCRTEDEVTELTSVADHVVNGVAP